MRIAQNLQISPVDSMTRSSGVMIALPIKRMSEQTIHLCRLRHAGQTPPCPLSQSAVSLQRNAALLLQHGQQRTVTTGLDEFAVQIFLTDSHAVETTLMVQPVPNQRAPYARD